MDEALSAALIERLQTGVILLDRQGQILSWNAWMVRYSGLTAESVAAQRLDEVFPEIAPSRFQNAIEQALRFNLSSMLAPGLSGAVLPLYQPSKDRTLAQRMQPLIYVTPLRYESCAVLIQIQDMTATVRRERRLRDQSSQLMATTYRDALTGVGNRRRFDHDLLALFRNAQKKQQSLALIMIDIDHFKAYNDHFGHPQGDECLIAVATALQETLRQRGDRVSRYGGEEFVLLLAETTRATACAIANRLRQRVEDLQLPHPTSRNSPVVTISIGVSAMIPTNEQLGYTLLGQADLALYRAKDEGRNRCFYYDAGRHDALSCGCSADEGDGDDLGQETA